MPSPKGGVADFEQKITTSAVLSQYRAVSDRDDR